MELLMYVYGDTCRKICEDLISQIDEAIRHDDIVEAKRIIRLAETPVRLYHRYHDVNDLKPFKLPKL